MSAGLVQRAYELDGANNLVAASMHFMLQAASRRLLAAEARDGASRLSVLLRAASDPDEGRMTYHFPVLSARDYGNLARQLETAVARLYPAAHSEL
jgi:hypothetical protein